MLRACAAAAACRRAGAPPPPPRAQLPSSRDAYARPRPAPPPPGWRNGWRHGRRRVTGDQGQIVLQGSTQLPVPITLMPHTHTHLALPQRAPQPLGVCRGACVESKQAQPSASWRSGGCFQRQGRPQAAPSFGQPRPISRLGGAGLAFDRAPATVRPCGEPYARELSEAIFSYRLGATWPRSEGKGRRLRPAGR